MSGKLSLSILFALFAVALSDTTQESQKLSKVNVTIYYEALCGDSAKFVTTQVYPLIANQSSSIAHYLNVTFVPFGKSKFTNSSVPVNKSDVANATVPSTADAELPMFECHHGEEECLGNKYQACAIQHITDKPTLYKYINCTMATGHLTKGSNYSVGKSCAEELKVDAATLFACVNGTEGPQLLAHYGHLTLALKPKLESVPEITFNDVFAESKQKDAEKNLKAVVCKEIPNSAKLVSECAAIPNSAPSVLAASVFMMAAAFVASRVY